MPSSFPPIKDLEPETQELLDRMYTKVSPCKTARGLEALPRRPLKLNLSKLEPFLVTQFNLKVIKRLPIMLLLSHESGATISIFQSGKIHVRDIVDLQQATLLLASISRIISDFSAAH